MASPTSKVAQNVVIFGGLGFIGRYTCDAFADAGHQVTVVDYSTASDDFPHPSIVAGLDQPEKYLDAVSAADVVVCLASSSLPGTANADLQKEVYDHVGSTMGLAELCAGVGVKTFLFASSGGTVYGSSASSTILESDPTRPINAYGASKSSIESYLRVLSSISPMTCRSLRIANPFGAGQDPRRKQGFVAVAINALLSQEPLTIWGDGSIIRDYVHVADVANAFVAASTYQGEFLEFNIGSGTGRSLVEVVKEVERAFASEIDVRFEVGRNVDVPANVLNINRAFKELRWRPMVSFVDALDEFSAEWTGSVLDVRESSAGEEME